MTLTLDEVRRTRFHMARRAGYEVTDVDNFVDKVEATMMHLVEENGTLKAQLKSVASAEPSSDLAQGDSEAIAAATAAGAATGELERLRAQVAELTARNAELTRQAAHASHDQPRVGETITVATSADASVAVVRLVQLATEQAEQVVSEADEEAKRKLAEAEQRAQELTTKARDEAERRQSEALEAAQKVSSEAKQKSERLEAEVAERRSELVSGLQAEQAALLGRIDQLRSFEQTWRANLTTHLEGQVKALREARLEPDASPGLLDGPRQQQAAPMSATSATPRLDALLADPHADEK